MKTRAYKKSRIAYAQLADVRRRGRARRLRRLTLEAARRDRGARRRIREGRRRVDGRSRLAAATVQALAAAVIAVAPACHDEWIALCAALACLNVGVWAQAAARQAQDGGVVVLYACRRDCVVAAGRPSRSQRRRITNAAARTLR
ncbi:hypothetical protein [Paractinoplanes toevensis]|uniref:Uncharacterized protein n=1 Tax=Paractinoplanes toevensis TaxID=571911 RepID=A0A919WCY9_9ACTN|nr:hypothetical protein [Actinoplanes toevensis]GIM97939.1 hypothetical protein Ato02nite_097320 [Actinoplanes toevensis]